jgi:putative transposase
MARIARIVVPGSPHHVVQRGVRSMDIFRDDGDRKHYLDLLSDFGKRHGVQFWAWCLMTNHVHLVAVPAAEDSLARAVGQAHKHYAQSINRREKARGHLFQERFYSYPIQQDGHFLAVVRYVELNPVVAGIASRAEKHKWSSAGYHLSGHRDPLIENDPVKAMVARWDQFLQDAVETAKERALIDRHLNTGRPFGEDGWVRRLEETTGRKLTSRRYGL